MARPSPGGHECSLMGISPDIRRKSYKSFSLLTQPQNIDKQPSVYFVDGKVAVNEHREVALNEEHTYALQGVGVLSNCKRLNEEGMSVLYGDNYLVAIIGREDRAINNMESVGMLAYWTTRTWPGKWIPERAAYKLTLYNKSEYEYLSYHHDGLRNRCRQYNGCRITSTCPDSTPVPSHICCMWSPSTSNGWRYGHVCLWPQRNYLA